GGQHSIGCAVLMLFIRGITEPGSKCGAAARESQAAHKSSIDDGVQRVLIAHAEYVDVAIDAAAGEHGAIAREGERRGAIVVIGQRCRERSVAGVPEPYLIIVARGGEKVAVGRECVGVDAAGVLTMTPD